MWLPLKYIFTQLNSTDLCRFWSHSLYLFLSPCVCVCVCACVHVFICVLPVPNWHGSALLCMNVTVSTFREKGGLSLSQLFTRKRVFKTEMFHQTFWWNRTTELAAEGHKRKKVAGPRLVVVVVSVVDKKRLPCCCASVFTSHWRAKQRWSRFGHLGVQSRFILSTRKRTPPPLAPSVSVADPGGPGGPVPPCTQDFFLNHAVFRQI